MAQQLLTLTEIRTLLARQADDETVQEDQVISLEGGKRLLETVALPEVQASEVGVSDVVSSVRSIMASEMAAQREVSQPAVLIQAQGNQHNSFSQHFTNLLIGRCRACPAGNERGAPRGTPPSSPP